MASTCGAGRIMTICCLIILGCIACTPGNTLAPTATSITEFVDPSIIQPPHTVQEAIRMLTAYSAEERIVAAQVIPTLGSDAVQAVPALIANLEYPYNPDVRRFAAQALGYFGPAAQAAVPVILRRLSLAETYIQERRAMTTVLGHIGDKSVVPALVPQLYSQEAWIETAEVLGHLGQQTFPDQGKRGYHIGDDGVPLIVIAARYWWEHEGRFRDWPTPTPP